MCVFQFQIDISILRSFSADAGPEYIDYSPEQPCYPNMNIL